MSDIFSFMILELLKFVNHNGAMTIKCLQGNLVNKTTTFCEVYMVVICVSLLCIII